MKTSFKQKLSLFFFGLLLAVILLEIGMRVAGGIVLYLQERQNHVSFDPNEYRILCLGESTTALGFEDSYPSQLEGILNKQGLHKKFTVINKGIVSITTDHVLAHIDQNLDTYKPQLVILMIGINDTAYMLKPHKILWLENIKLFYKNFRVYKLLHLLHKHIAHRIKEIENNSSDSPDVSDHNDYDQQTIENFLRKLINNLINQYYAHDYAYKQYQQNSQTEKARQEAKLAKDTLVALSAACIQLAQRDRQEGDFQEAMGILQHAALLDPTDAEIYQELGDLYLAQKDHVQAIRSFQVALTLDPKNSTVLPKLARAYYQAHNSEAFLVYAEYLQLNPQDYWGFIEFAQWLKEYKHYELAEQYLIKAMELRSNFEQAFAEMGQLLDDQGKYGQEEAFLLKETVVHPKSPRLFQELGQLYHRQGKEDMSQACLLKASQQEAAWYYPATFVNYSLILNKILNRHIKAVIMQYPLRDISPLREHLGQKNDIFFVENRQNFKEAVAKNGFNYYFKDNFAYDFGHCTRAGNELIARNLTDLILKKVLGPEGQY